MQRQNLAPKPWAPGLTAAFLLAFPVGAAGSPFLSLGQDADVEWGYVGSATSHGDRVRFDSGAEISSAVRYLFSPQVTSRLLLHVGAEWEGFSFETPARAPLPDMLQEVSLPLGLDWQVTDRWLLRAAVRPGVYSDFQDVSWKDVDAPFLLSAAYLVSPDLQWVFGLRVDPRSHYPVIPGLGVRWKFADTWTLNAVLPKPRLEFDITPRFQAYLGSEFKAETFRVSDSFGNSQGWSQLNGGVLDYFEVRVGPGFLWNIRPKIAIEASAGYMVYRRFEFGDRDVVWRSDPAPYVQIGLRFRF